jgi:hypothetical protein
MLNITQSFSHTALLATMEDIISAQHDLSKGRAERQMAEALAPHILTTGIVILHAAHYPVAGVEEVFELLDTGWQEWRLSIMRQIDDEGDLHAEDFLKAVLERLYDSAWYNSVLDDIDDRNDQRPLHGTEEGERYYSGSGESPDDPSYEAYLNRPGPIPGWY